MSRVMVKSLTPREKYEAARKAGSSISGSPFDTYQSVGAAIAATTSRWFSKDVWSTPPPVAIGHVFLADAVKRIATARLGENWATLDLATWFEELEAAQTGKGPVSSTPLSSRTPLKTSPDRW